MMIRRSITLFFLTFVCLFATAQIQRTFFGLTLGVTTKSKAVRILHSKGINVLNQPSPTPVSKVILCDSGIIFGGESYTGVFFEFVNNRLATVMLIKVDSKTVMSLYKKVEESLIRKYANIGSISIIKESGRTFIDRKTKCNCALLPFLGDLEFRLIYEDARLAKIRDRSSSSEY